MKIPEIAEWWKKTKDTTLGTAIYIIGGFVFAWLAMAGLGFALQTDTPVVAVFSQSMVPSFYKGDMIIVSEPGGGITGMFLGKNKNDYKVGDVVVFDAQSGEYKFPIIHRVIAVNPDGTLETKGDANSGQGEFEHNIPPSAVHGKAIMKIPLLGWIKVGLFEGLKII